MHRQEVPEGGEPQASPEDNLLSEFVARSDLATQLRISESTLREWGSAGKGPAPTKIGQKVYYHRDTVRAWLRGLETNPWPAGGRS